MNREHRGFLFSLLAVFFSSTMALFVKLASSVPVSTLVFTRFVIGVPIFLWIIRRNKIRLEWKKLPKNLTRSLSGISALYASYFALQHLPLVNAITLTNTAPLFLPILYLVWDKILVSKWRFFAAGIGFLGVVVILRPEGTDFFVWASVLGLVAGFFRAVSTFNVRMLAKVETTQTILAYYFFIGAVISFFPFLYEWKPVDNPIEWIYVLSAGSLALAFQYTFTKACADVAATKVSSMNYLGVVLGGLFGWWVFGEIPDIWVFIGTILILVGAITALLDRTPPIDLKKP